MSPIYCTSYNSVLQKMLLKNRLQLLLAHHLPCDIFWNPSDYEGRLLKWSDKIWLLHTCACPRYIPCRDSFAELWYWCKLCLERSWLHQWRTQDGSGESCFTFLLRHSQSIRKMSKSKKNSPGIGEFYLRTTLGLLIFLQFLNDWLRKKEKSLSPFMLHVLWIPGYLVCA